MDFFGNWYAAASGLVPHVSQSDAEKIFAAGMYVGAGTIDALVPNLFAYGATLKIGVQVTPSGYSAASPNFQAHSNYAHLAVLKVAKAEAENKKKKIILLGE